MFFPRSMPAAACLMLFTGMSGRIEAKGIAVRFLACPPEDSIVRYEISRSDSLGGSALILGTVPPAAGGDTLGFQDLLAEKGRPYFYSIRGINAAGVPSDPSEPTQVGFPVLSLPDTLRPDILTGMTRILLPIGCDPLRGGAEPLALALMDSSRFSISFDPATRAASFRSRSGKADTGWVILRAQYFGKFEAKAPALVLVAANTVSIPAASAAPAASRSDFPARYSPLSQGPLSLSGLPGPGRLEILTLLGTRTSALTVPAPRVRLVWDGKGESGRYLRPARYLWVLRGLSGAVLESGSFLIVP
jgi:hypothetical protein